MTRDLFGANPSKTIETVAIDRLDHSRFNARATRAPEAIERLASRITRNGFEVTRALWAYPVADRFEVFAGGTRLEAARAAGVGEVPVVVHRGLSEDEIVRLGDEDNENDEYHVPVPVLDRWADCHRLWRVEGWTQQRIAEAKGCSRTDVVLRCRLHESCPDVARAAVSDGLFDESHLRAVIEVVSDVRQLAPWLTTAQAQDELVREVLGKHRGSSAGIKPSVKNVREAAKRWKAMIAAAEKAHADLAEEPWQTRFVEALVAARARGVAAVSAAEAEVRKGKADEARRKADEAKAESDAEAKAAAKAERIEALTSRIVMADAREAVLSAPAGASLVITDPPYGVDFVSSRRTATAKKTKIANDGDPRGAADLVREVLAALLPRLADNAHVLVFTGWRHEPLFREAVEAAGLTLKGSLVWVKNNHGTGDLKGSFAPKHERILHAVKGSPEMVSRIPDVLHGKDAQNSEHPTEKPVELLRQLIEATTQRGDVVLDPFAGSGSALFAAHEAGRDFWGCELDEGFARSIADRLHHIATGGDR